MDTAELPAPSQETAAMTQEEINSNQQNLETKICTQCFYLYLANILSIFKKPQNNEMGDHLFTK